jgi:hypothetical protein
MLPLFLFSYIRRARLRDNQRVAFQLRLMVMKQYKVPQAWIINVSERGLGGLFFHLRHFVEKFWFLLHYFSLFLYEE